MNLALLEGVVTEVDESLSAHLNPGPGRCCVVLTGRAD
jgi:hypothetical protein